MKFKPFIFVLSLFFLVHFKIARAITCGELFPALQVKLQESVNSISSGGRVTAVTDATETASGAHLCNITTVSGASAPQFLAKVYEDKSLCHSEFTGYEAATAAYREVLAANGIPDDVASSLRYFASYSQVLVENEGLCALVMRRVPGVTIDSIIARVFSTRVTSPTAPEITELVHVMGTLGTVLGTIHKQSARLLPGVAPSARAALASYSVIKHPDWHAGNIIYQAGGARPSLFFIDWAVSTDKFPVGSLQHEITPIYEWLVVAARPKKAKPYTREDLVRIHILKAALAAFKRTYLASLAPPPATSAPFLREASEFVDTCCLIKAQDLHTAAKTGYCGSKSAGVDPFCH